MSFRGKNMKRGKRKILMKQEDRVQVKGNGK
jgi:hypothetical protein